MDDSFILSRVFSHLPLKDLLLLETVSSTWSRTVARHWRSVRCLVIGDDLYEADQWYQKEQEKKEMEICMLLRRCGPHLTKLRLAPINVKPAHGPFARRHYMTERVLSAICEYCTNIKVLDLSYYRFETRTIIDLLCNMPVSIQILLMDNVIMTHYYGRTPDRLGDDDVMNALFNRLVNLKGFSLSDSFCSPAVEIRISQLPPSLTYLHLMGIQSAKTGPLQTGIPNLVYLQYLHLQNPSINDSDLRNLVQACRSTLRGLSLIDARNITDFSPIAAFPNLTFLCLDSNADTLTDSAVIQICRHCTGLRHFSLESNRIPRANSPQYDSLNRHMPAGGKFYLRFGPPFKARPLKPKCASFRHFAKKTL